MDKSIKDRSCAGSPPFGIDGQAIGAQLWSRESPKPSDPYYFLNVMARSEIGPFKFN